MGCGIGSRCQWGETDEEHFTAAQFLAYRGERLGIPVGQRIAQPVTLLTFQQQIAEQFVNETHARPAGEGFSTQTHAPMWVGTLGGARVTIQRLPIGAPTATAAFELLIAGGAQIFLLAGVAGSRAAAPIGSVIIPTGALREEGVSHHYLPPDADPLPGRN